MSEPGRDRLLAFDCSGAACSAAVLIDGEIRARRFEAMERGQAEALLPMIRRVMQDSGMTFDRLDGLATTVGPGSFTGLRIGLAAARGLALAADLPILALTGFEAYLGADDSERRQEEWVAVAIDSRRGPVFIQLFRPDGTPEGAPLSLDRDAVAAWLQDRPVFVTGDGAPLIDLPPRPRLRVAAGLPRIHAAELFGSLARLPKSLPERRPALPLYLRAPDVTLPKGLPCA
jgi:tRNA threonylcarbamoyladenosine biosynthesis protein TsaB